MFPTKSLTPSTLRPPAKPRRALVAAADVVGAVEAEAAAANKLSLKLSPPKASHHQSRQERMTLQNSPSLRPLLRLHRHSR